MPVLPAPTPNAATLGPITSAGRRIVNASAAQGLAGTSLGNTHRTRGL